MLKRLSLCLLLGLAPSSLRAADVAWLVGGGVGGEIPGPTSEQAGGFGVEGDDRSYKLFAGLAVGPYAGLEAAYHDFGSQHCCTGPVQDFGFDLDLEGYSVAAVASLPWRRFAVFGKVGSLWWEESGTEIGLFGARDVSTDGSGLLVGAGLSFQVAEHFALRGEWDQYDLEEAADTGWLGLVLRW